MMQTMALRAFKVAAVAVLAACAGSDPIGNAGNGSIRGIVTDNTGARVASAPIELSGNGQARRTDSGPEGMYTFADLPAGTYTLTVEPPGGFAIGAVGTASVTVTGGAEATASAFVLNRTTGSIRGVVRDDTGAGVAGATVRLTGNAQGARTANSGADGAYSFAGILPGTYTLAVTPPAGYTIGADAMTSVTLESAEQVTSAAIVLNRMSPDDAFAAVLHARLVAATSATEFSGAVLVRRNGSTLFEGAYGRADRSRGIPNSLVTQFRVASMKKMVTAVAVLQLVQAGKVRLDAPLSTYLPDYPNAELASRVTIHHLLTHTGGTGDIFGPLYDANRLQLRTSADWIRIFGTRALLFEPGTQHVYSNYGYILLGAVIEQAAGMDYYEYVQRHIHEPAGMTLTGSAPEDSVVPGRAVGYTWQLVQGSLVSNESLLPYRGMAAGGGYSTVGDMARFAEALR